MYKMEERIATKKVLWDFVIKWLKASATAGWLYHRVRQPNPGCWLTSWFESPRERLAVSLFQGPISYGCFTGATLYVLCLDSGLIRYTNFFLIF